MEVKPGYKQTEVGVIPEDWNLLPLLNLTSNIGDGIHTTPVYSQNSDYYFINGNNLYNGKIVVTEETKTVDYFEYKKHHKDLDDKSILMSINGTIGNLGLYAGESVILGKSAAYVNVKDSISKLYIYHSIQTELVNRQFFDGLTGTTIKNLGLATIRNTLLPLPPTLAEQEAIAGALSDADALIESLEQLIAKKRLVKQGAMQELLTGKRRLPGFSGEWETKRLGEIAHIQTGSSNNQDKVDDGEYPFFVRSATVERINSFSYDCEAILIPGEGGIGSIYHYINGRFDVHQRVYAITKFSSETSGKFVYFYMTKNFGTHAMENSVKATVDSLRLPTFQNFKLTIPPTTKEQIAITSILSDMDAEISALEGKLSKARQLKQGMMQELLTGRIRLV